MDILGPDGAAALAAASDEADPDSLAAGERLRKRFPPELSAAALTQVSLRRRGMAKLGRDDLFLTSAGLEQATRAPVAAWRAHRFVAAGVAEVWDLGCGIGADACAFEVAGITARAVEIDLLTAAFATANLELVGGAPAIVAAVEDVSVPGEAGVFLDPARRTGVGRTWRLADFTPPWSLVIEYLRGPRFCAVKLGPGLPKEVIPEGVQATYVSHGGDVVEVSLWNGLQAGPVAVVFPRDGGAPLELGRDDRLDPLAVGGIGAYVIEPDNAIIRAGLLREALAGHTAWLMEEHIAYATSNEPVDSPLVDCFRVTDVLDFDVARLRRHLARHRIGTLEIKKRAINVDPAGLRRKFRLSGPNSATLILARTPSGTRAVLTERCAPARR